MMEFPEMTMKEALEGLVTEAPNSLRQDLYYLAVAQNKITSGYIFCEEDLLDRDETITTLDYTNPYAVLNLKQLNSLQTSLTNLRITVMTATTNDFQDKTFMKLLKRDTKLALNILSEWANEYKNKEQIEAYEKPDDFFDWLNSLADYDGPAKNLCVDIFITLNNLNVDASFMLDNL